MKPTTGTMMLGTLAIANGDKIVTPPSQNLPGETAASSTLSSDISSASSSHPSLVPPTANVFSYATGTLEDRTVSPSTSSSPADDSIATATVSGNSIGTDPTSTSARVSDPPGDDAVDGHPVPGTKTADPPDNRTEEAVGDGSGSRRLDKGIVDTLPTYRWGWPAFEEGTHRAPEPNFSKTECTGELIDLGDARRAARYLARFCRSRPVADHRLWASTTDRTTIYMCAFGGERNCSLGLWQAASDRLNRECGMGGTGFVEVEKLRLGREAPFGMILCRRVNLSPLWEYRISQRETLVDGKPFLEWKATERLRDSMDAAAGDGIGEGTDGGN